MIQTPAGGVKEIIRVLPPKGSHYPFRQKVLEKALNQDPDSPVLPFLMKVVKAQESAYQVLQASNEIPEFQSEEPFIVMNDVIFHSFQRAIKQFCITLAELTHTKNSCDYSEIIKAIDSLATNLEDQHKTEQFFHDILTLDLEALPSHQRLFLLAAMQVTLHFAASKLTVADDYIIQEKELCPCCKMPAISAVLDNAEDGLRYLYCSFCETKWHVVRSICTECNSNKSLFQATLEPLESPMSAEVCGECRTYLKFLDRTKTLLADPFIEDLLTLPLAIKLDDKNYQTFGLNPYFV